MTQKAHAAGPRTRKAFFNTARRHTPYVAGQVDELVFLVSTGDRLGRGLFARRWRQDVGHLEGAVRILREHGADQAGSTFVDVGANIGTTTVSAVRRHGFARAVAIEPAPDNFRVLRLNVLLNEIETSVTALHAAVCDREGEGELALTPRSSGTHMLRSLVPSEGKEVVTVQMVTLDGLVRRGVLTPNEVGLLWVDAAGAEALVLAGATALLERGVAVAVALRPELPHWVDAQRVLVEALAGYTHFVDLRHLSAGVGDSLAALLASPGRSGDVLAFRP